VDSRAVSPLIGFILLMAIVMGLIGILQSTAVPQWNKAAEARHLSTLKYEVADISRVISISASTGNPAKVVLNAGVSYPNYYILFSPSKASTTITAKNLSVRVDGSLQIQDQSSAIVVEPNYLYSSRSRFIYEHSAVLREEMNGVILVESSQSAFSSNSIHLAIVKAKFGTFATAETASIILVPESVGGSSIFNGYIELECYDKNTAQWWNETLSSIYGQDNVSVVNNTTVKIRNLQNIPLSISVFSAYAVSAGEILPELPQRVLKLANVSQRDFTVYQGSTVILIAKVVDNYGNPVRGVTVSIQDSCNGNSGQTSDENGLVVYYFNAACVGGNTVTFSANSSSIAFSIQVLLPPSGGGSQLRIGWYNESGVLSKNCTWSLSGNPDTRNFYVNVYASNLLVCFTLNNTSVSVTKDKECELSNSTGWVSVRLTAQHPQTWETPSFKVFAISQNSFATLNITLIRTNKESIVCS